MWANISERGPNMRRWLWSGLVVVSMGIGSASAQSILVDQFLPLQPGLSVSVTQDLGIYPCGNSPSGPGWFSFVCGTEGDGNLENAIDAQGSFYRVRLRDATAEEQNCPTAWSKVYEVERRTGTDVEVVAVVPQQRLFCASDGTTAPCTAITGACPIGSRVTQNTIPFKLTADTINGHLYFAVRSTIFPGTGGLGVLQDYNYGVVKLSGLPAVLDVVPEGPAGPQGPIGPQGPPGTPADPTQVLALQQQVAALQGQVNALQLTLQQIENLPIIKRLLEKVQQLEQAVP
jgi:hypothetical protein